MKEVTVDEMEKDCDDEVRDGSVTLRGRPVSRRERGGLKAAFFLHSEKTFCLPRKINCPIYVVFDPGFPKSDSTLPCV
jgi:hypothetical protein